MRIVAGRFRSRHIEAPAGDTTRPTTDRVREALFSSLTSLAGPDLGAGACLDAFAGSGALGLEALSRGCTSTTFIERDRAALAALRRNIGSLGVTSETRIITGDTLALARSGAVPGGPFALLMLDPPYRLDPALVGGFLGMLAAHDLLEDGCVVVWEHARDVSPAWPEGFSACTSKRYGTTEVDVAVYERGAGST